MRVALAAILTTATACFASGQETGWPGKAGSWHGFARHDFTVDGRAARVVEPKHASPGKPWVWRARFPDYHPEVDKILLERGFHVAFLNTDGMLGSPRSMEHWDAFYAFMTGRGFAPRVALEGVSRGGLFVYGFASRWPERVACIYADTPVGDIKSWPGGKGGGRGHAPTWQACLDEYGFSEQQAVAYQGNPVDILEPIVQEKIPLLHIVSLNDVIVPPAENTFVLARRVRELGGSIDVIEVAEGTEQSGGHHFTHPAPLRVADFIERSLKVPGRLSGSADYFELRGSLENSRIKFQQTRTGRVVFLGGSITNMNGWRQLTMKYLQERFPETEFDFVNAGIPSTGSTPGAFRLLRDVFGRGPVDLLFEEAAVNDLHNSRTSNEITRGMEGILRHARDVNPMVDIVVMHFVDPRHMQDYRAGSDPMVIATQEAVAAHYAVPTLHLAREVTERIDLGQFTWEQDFRDLHPSPFGHLLYASTIRRMLSTAWSRPLAETAQLTPHALPEGSLDPFSYDNARLVELSASSSLRGFESLENCDPRAGGIGGGTRPGFVNVPMLVGTKPGDSFQFEFTGRAAGLFVAAGPDSGIIESRIDGGAWSTQDLFTPWSGGLHLPWAYLLATELSPKHHTLEVRIAAAANPRSKGNACRVVHFLVNGSCPTSNAATGDWPTYRADAARTAFTQAPLPDRLQLSFVHRAALPPTPAWPRLKRMAFDRAFYPVIADGRLIFASSADGTVYALDAATGEQLWNFPTDAPVRFAPALLRDRVFVGSDDGYLYCLSARDGSLIYKKRGGPHDRKVLGNGRMISRWPVRGGPVIVGETVYFAAGIWPSEGIYLYALEAETGETVWLNEDSGSLYMPQPHGGANAESGVSAQGHLVATEDLLLVPTGRAVPAAFDRATGEFLYYHLQKNGHAGGTATMASGKHFFNSGRFFEAKTGSSQGSTGGAAIAGLPDGIVTASLKSVDAYRWQVVEPEQPGGKKKRTLGKFTSIEGMLAGNCVVVAGRKVIAGGQGIISVADLDSGAKLNTLDVEGTVHALAIADGRLYASTDQGAIYCFSNEPAHPAGLPPRVDVRMLEVVDQETPIKARDILSATGVRSGFCVDLGCRDGQLIRVLAEDTDLYFLGVDSDPGMVEAARRRLREAGLYGVRAWVHQSTPNDTHYPRYSADLVVSSRDLIGSDASIAREAARLQRPLGGVVYIDPQNVNRRDALPGSGSWTHQYADAGNTVCSDDAIHGTLRALWYREVDQDLTQRHGRGPSPLYKDGRLFSLGLHSLLAIDAYNGRTLWEYPLEDILTAFDGDHLMGTSGTHSPYCISDEGLFVRRNNQCLVIDPASGTLKATYSAPDVPGDHSDVWGFIACVDGVLLGSLANTAHVVTFRYVEGGDLTQQLTESSALFALDAGSGEVLWTHQARRSVRHNAIAAGGGKLFYVDRAVAEFDRERGKKGEQALGELTALDLRTGAVLWDQPEDVFGTTLAYQEEHDALVMSYQPTRFRLESEVGGRIAVHRGSNGARLWDDGRRYDSRPLIVGSTVYAQGAAWDLLTGEPRPFNFSRSYGCGVLASGTRTMVYRSATLGYFDLVDNDRNRDYGGLRPGCWINALPVGGLVLVPDGSAGCACSYQNKAWMALVPEDQNRPEVSPPGGAFPSPIEVEIENPGGGAQLHYTLDDSMPTPASPVVSGPLRIESDAVLRVRAMSTDQDPSPTARHEFIIDGRLLPLDAQLWRIWDQSTNVNGSPGRWTLEGSEVVQHSNIHSKIGVSETDPGFARYGTLRIYTGPTLGDGTLEFDIKSNDDDGIGVALRVQDEAHHYLFAMDRQRGFRSLARRSGDDYTVLAKVQAGYETGRWHHVRVALEGPRLQVHVDGESVADIIDETYPSGTIALHSYGNSGTHFRRIRWTPR